MKKQVLAVLLTFSLATFAAAQIAIRIGPPARPHEVIPPPPPRA